ncbi:DUF3575 domain-containing protein [Flavilitoribacter nigricans]|uniref:Outer membrane protein beta-barrel domain-containing protein n=1 Tax=Flavilitoribacter nigricans (strain ATCC 23147 / DSM 23189 / NBRC 102662 / NCIMB 1420 / SS-2) TaxID=1122177 RepID=A0A2D0N9G7_FLAN2|nr:DUF3575 domain-containing protein [Flavilitoribacter nigricans]PHN05016.1 hypothetical protein CRP01_18485 [Flavilitoribacter nigricans DSM 23189 = NBRC 102662]
MKAKLFKLAFAIVFCFGCASVSAQSLIKANPFGLAFGVLNASYEKFVSENASFTLRANFYSRKLAGVRFTGFGAGGGYRFYLSNSERPKGLYVGPIANIATISTDDDDVSSYALITIGGVIGYQLRLSDRFYLDFNVGPTYGIITGKGIDDDFDAFGAGTLPTITIATVGYLLN